MFSKRDVSRLRRAAKRAAYFRSEAEHGGKARTKAKRAAGESVRVLRFAFGSEA